MTKSSISSSSVSKTESSHRIGWTGPIGIVISVVLLWWVLRDISLGEMAADIRQAKLLPYLLAMLAATLTFPARTVRWRYLLRLEGAELPFVPLWHATAIGFMANNLLPARAGEFARAFVAGRLTGVRFTSAVASLAVERVMDGLFLIGMMALATAGGGFTTDLVIGGTSIAKLMGVLAGIFAGALLAALVVVQRPDPFLALARKVTGLVLPERAASKLVGLIEGFLLGLDSLKSPRRFAAVAFWSLVVWSINALSFWICFKAFGIDVPWTGALVLQGMIGIGVAIPAAPGFFGLFEAASRISLALYGIAATSAVTYAVAYHVGGFIPITLLGLWSLSRADLRLRDLRSGKEEPRGDDGRGA